MADIKKLEEKIKNLEERVAKLEEKLNAKDPLYNDAKRLVTKHHKASVFFLQKHLLVDFDRAVKILEELKKEGLPVDNSK